MGQPAIHVGHLHSCPSHTGERVQGPAAPTILLEGKPAARIGDKIGCKGEAPALLTTGEDTVLFNGAVAAHVFSLTTHRSALSECSLTILVGRIKTGKSKAERVAARKLLIAAGYARAAAMKDDNPDKKTLLDALDELARLNTAVEHARLCDANYGAVPLDYPNNTTIDYTKVPEGWDMVGFPEGNPGTGFQATTYRSQIDGSIVVVFRGTDPETWQDWLIGNVGQSAQHFAAVDYARRMQAIYGDKVVLTGDSLGGGLAAYASLYTGIPANVYNPAPIHPYLLDDPRLLGADPNAINAYTVDGEALSYLPGVRPGKHHPKLEPYGGPSGQPGQRRTDIPFAGSLLNAWKQGFQRALAPKDGGRGLLFGIKDGMEPWAVEAVLRHFPETVVDSIEHLKTQNIATIGRY